MVGPFKGCTEINQNDTSLLPTLQCPLQCMGHTQKCITGTQIFQISKQCCWKHITAFLKSTKTKRHQALKHLGQCWCCGNRSVIGNRRWRLIFRNRGDIGLPPASRETTKRTNRIKTALRRGTITSAVLDEKKETYLMGQRHHKGPSVTRDDWPRSTWRQWW